MYSHFHITGQMLYLLLSILLLTSSFVSLSSRLHRSSVIVLGQKLHANSTMTKNLQMRLEKGVEQVFIVENCTCVIMSGGAVTDTDTNADADTDADIEKRPEAHVMGEEFLSLLEKCNFEAVTKLIKMNPEIVAEDMSKNTIEVRIW